MSLLGVSNTNHRFIEDIRVKIFQLALNQCMYFTSLCGQDDKEKEGVIKTSTTSKINRKVIIRNTVCL